MISRKEKQERRREVLKVVSEHMRPVYDELLREDLPDQMRTLVRLLEHAPHERGDEIYRRQ
jgi:hypothetical protein